MEKKSSPDRAENTEEKQGEQGQAYIEFIIVLPLMIILFYFVGVQAWWWWNQTTAAVAIHDGTAAMGHHGGSLAEGHAEVREALTAALGGVASEYAGTYRLVDLPAMRATTGYIRNETVVDIPYVGSRLFTVEARSFQRREQFYGGPPSFFE